MLYDKAFKNISLTYGLKQLKLNYYKNQSSISFSWFYNAIMHFKSFF